MSIFRRKDFFRLVLGLICLTIMMSACGQPAVPALTPISVQLLWTHNATFSGFYAADQEGFYAAEGLAVTFIEGGPTVDLIAPVLKATAQFGIAGADALLLARTIGQPIRAIAVIDRRSPLVFGSLADSGITRPQDFVSKTIRVTPQVIPALHAMMERLGISPDQYTEVTLPSDVATFDSGQAQVWGLYLNNFAITLQQTGHELNYIYPDDYGVHFYGDTLFATDELIATQPDLVLRFLRATLKGWTWAVENAAQTGALVQKYSPNIDPSIEIAKMTASLPLVNTGEDQIGWMKAEVWTGMEQMLREQGVLTEPLDVTQVYTTQFLEEIYK
jgi:NitT/TauT family transport system substrate-binding protein